MCGGVSSNFPLKADIMQKEWSGILDLNKSNLFCSQGRYTANKGLAAPYFPIPIENIYILADPGMHLYEIADGRVNVWLTVI